MSTVTVHRTAKEALEESDRRPMKAVWKNGAARIYAVGDWSDLPGDVPGFWHELSYRELADLC